MSINTLNSPPFSTINSGEKRARDDLSLEKELDHKKRKIESSFLETINKQKENLFLPLTTIRYPNGSFYEGECRNGVPNGKGKLTFFDGSSYEGDWVNGIKEGKGLYIFSDGTFYNGDWVNDVKHGKGKYVYLNGLVCEGEWINDQIVTSIKNLSDDLFFDLLCGSHENMAPNGYCLGILQDYLEKKGRSKMAHFLKEALRCSFLSKEETEKESHIIYDELNNKNQSRLICYGYDGHEMGLKLVPGIFPGFILCKIFNTGDGLDIFHEVHPSNPNKYKLQLEIQVPIEHLTPDVIQTLLLSVKKSKNANEAYDHILNLPGAQILPSDSFPWQTSQKGNDCTLQWIRKVYFEAEMPPGQGQQMRRRLEEDCKEARASLQKTYVQIKDFT